MLLILLLSITTTSVALLTLSSSINDAEAVNVAGSLRMQSYRLAFDIETNSENLSHHLIKFEQSLSSPALLALNHWIVPDEIEHQYHQLTKRWQLIQLELTDNERTNYVDQVSEFVEEIDLFVLQLQEFSEHKLLMLAITGGAGLTLILFASLFIIQFTQRKIVSPLNQLVAASRSMTQGNFDIAVNIKSDNELGLLGNAFNHMAKDLGNMYSNLEQSVDEKTRKLSLANDSLHTLYQCSQQLTVSQLTQANFQSMLNTLVQVDGITAAKLVVEEDNGGTWDIMAGTANGGDWHQEKLIIDGELLGYLAWQFTLPCPDHKLIINVSRILARGVYYNQAQKQAQHLLLMEERATIARELHDSLAQSLSYLKIQMTLLKRQLNDCQCPNTGSTLAELDNGLKSAYTQLRELLNTFRLTIKQAHFGEALTEMITPLMAQTNAKITIDNSLSSLPLDANCHVHLLQLIREAVLNAIKHAKADSIMIRCDQSTNHGHITVIDNGCGFNPNEEKVNHYGLGIMHERANRIHGELNIDSEPNAGCQVSLNFPLKIQ